MEKVNSKEVKYHPLKYIGAVNDSKISDLEEYISIAKEKGATHFTIEDAATNSKLVLTKEVPVNDKEYAKLFAYNEDNYGLYPTVSPERLITHINRCIEVGVRYFQYENGMVQGVHFYKQS